MQKKQEIIIGAISSIIERKKAANRQPECATRREIEEEVPGKVSFHELTKILMDLVKAGKITYRPTVNDQSYYLV